MLPAQPAGARVRSAIDICGRVYVDSVVPTPTSVEQVWQVGLEAQTGPAVFKPKDFFGHEPARKLEERFWKGGLMLVTRKQIEDPDFWTSHNIALAVSMNGGCFHEEDNDNEGWFLYPMGRKAMNIPISSKERRVQRTRSCLPHILAALAAGKNVGLHCLNTVHRGPLGSRWSC